MTKGSEKGRRGGEAGPSPATHVTAGPEASHGPATHVVLRHLFTQPRHSSSLALLCPRTRSRFVFPQATLQPDRCGGGARPRQLCDQDGDRALSWEQDQDLPHVRAHVEYKAGMAAQPEPVCQQDEAGRGWRLAAARGRPELDLALALAGRAGGRVGRSLWACSPPHRWAEFDAFCAASDDPRDTLAQQVASRARAPRFLPARSLEGLRISLQQWWGSSGPRGLPDPGDDAR